MRQPRRCRNLGRMHDLPYFFFGFRVGPDSPCPTVTHRGAGPATHANLIKELHHGLAIGRIKLLALLGQSAAGASDHGALRRDT